ncbi:MAG TPA: glycosyltransferase family 4 protein [Burkholderiales bacterium]|nr:glycosyltransferase family 4 protein [Burkholderiales bacterium]
MSIAQVAPLALPVPPRHYGGTERVVYDLTEALVARGHDVTLFASGDSQTSARLVRAVPRSLWSETALHDSVASLLRMHGELFYSSFDFDLIHTHTDYFALPFAALSLAPVLTTLHGRLDLPDVPEVLRLYPEADLISISHAQQAQAPGASWAGTVHHGVSLERWRFEPAGGDGLAFVGRFSPEKAPHLAIDVAVAAGVPITIAGRIEPRERAYFEREVAPRLEHPLVRYLGEVDDRQKQALLGASRALLFPIDWPEPFGLVMIEAMACGTPVIARARGAVREIVVDGETGIIAETFDELVAAVKDVQRLERAACRRRVERHFSVAAMADRYEELYWRRLADSPHVPFKAPPALRPRLRARAE